MILPLNLSTQRDFFPISLKLDVKYIPVPFDITILLNLVLSMRFSLISLTLFLVVIIQNRETFIHWGCKTHFKILFFKPLPVLPEWTIAFLCVRQSVCLSHFSLSHSPYAILYLKDKKAISKI